MVKNYSQFALIPSEFPRQFETQYLIYETEDFVDRLSSFAVMSVLAYAQDV